MAKRRPAAVCDIDFNESSVFWFARYEKGIEKGNTSLMAEAAGHLRRLGYVVDYRPFVAPAGPRSADEKRKPGAANAGPRVVRFRDDRPPRDLSEPLAEGEVRPCEV